MLDPLINDTIVAIATAPGRSSVGVIRLSGTKALEISEKICQKKLTPRLVHFCPFIDQTGSVVDKGVSVFFNAPHSFTGEDVVELHAHGSPIVLDLLVETSLYFGARHARPGEFSERAFLNNKIDLAQAEAIADLIAASTERTARSAIKSLQGDFSKTINCFIDSLVYLRTYIEAAMDFPDEEVDFLSDGKISEKLNALITEIEATKSSAHNGTIINEGINLVIVGKPNAGKSSLINALSGSDVAIVTDVPGTTRDPLRENIQIDGIPLKIIDTAGLQDTDDPVEKEGIKRTHKAIQNADHIILMSDISKDGEEPITLSGIWPDALQRLSGKIPITFIKNKIDLVHKDPAIKNDTVYLSAQGGQGLDLLKKRLKDEIGFQQEQDHFFSARRRHLHALDQAKDHIIRCINFIKNNQPSELLAEELRLAQRELEVITGRFTPDDLLDKIFRDFCIGK